MPINLSGRLRASARPVIGIVEVFEPKMTPGRITASTRFVTSALMSLSSNTASMM